MPQSLRATDAKGIALWFEKQRGIFPHPDVIILAAPKDTTIGTLLQILPGVEIVTAKMELLPTSGKKRAWQWARIWFKHEIFNDKVKYSWWKLTSSANSDTVHEALDYTSNS